MNPNRIPLDAIKQSLSSGAIKPADLLNAAAGNPPTEAASQPTPAPTPAEILNKTAKALQPRFTPPATLKPEVEPTDTPPAPEATLEPALEALADPIAPLELPKEQQPTGDVTDPVDPEEADAAPTETPPEENTQDPEEGEENPKEHFNAANVRKLRKAKREAETQLQAIRDELSQTKSKLEAYESGEALPEKVREYEERISQLETYEQLHALKFSPEYRQRYEQPLEQLKQTARELAQDYKVDARVFDQALRIEDKQKLNQFLKHHFKDDVAVIEAKEVLGKITNLAVEMDKAEQAPRETLQNLRAETQRREEAERAEIGSRVAKTARTSYSRALTDLQKTQQFPELIINPTDEIHNSMVRPILESAQSEYGKLVNVLVQNGLKHLPDEVATVLAKYVQLGRLASLTAASRNAYVQHSKELEANAQRTHNINRPPVGVAMPGTRGEVQSRPKDVREAVREHARQHLK